MSRKRVKGAGWRLGLMWLSLPVLAGGCAPALLGPPCSTAGPPPARQGGRVLTGNALGPFSATSQRAALGHALTRGLAELRVEVGDEFNQLIVTEARSENGRSSYEETLQASYEMTVKLKRAEVRGARTTYCVRPDTGQVEAQVRITPAEWTRLARATNGAVVVVVKCSTEPTGGCGPNVHAAVRDAARAAGLKVVTKLTVSKGEGLPDGQDAVRLGVAHNAAYVLGVELGAKVFHEDAKKVVAESWYFAKLVETSDGKTLESWDPPRGGNLRLPHRYKASVFKKWDRRPVRKALGDSLQQAIDGRDSRAQEPGLRQAMAEADLSL